MQMCNISQFNILVRFLFSVYIQYCLVYSVCPQYGGSIDMMTLIPAFNIIILLMLHSVDLQRLQKCYKSVLKVL